jgi:transposase
MSIVLLQPPVVKRKTETRPRQCPYCEGNTSQRWGKVRKPVRDHEIRTVQVYRYRCCGCRRTFRHYPQGVERSDQTERLRKLAALFWVLGMSLRGVQTALGVFGVSISATTVWRDI